MRDLYGHLASLILVTAIYPSGGGKMGDSN